MISSEQIIYFDNNATTQLDPAVIEEMLPFLTKYFGNPSSGYGFGAQVRGAVDLARQRVAALLGCEPGEIVFTSCGTESNNAAINSALQLDPARQHIVTTAVEHSATSRHCDALSKRGCAVTTIGVDGEGNLDLEELERAITPQTAIISAMWANNETGVVFPVDRDRGDCAEKPRPVPYGCDPGRGKDSDSAGGFDDQFPFAFRAQAAWPQRRGRALREKAIGLQVLVDRREPGKQSARWNRKCRGHRRVG